MIFSFPGCDIKISGVGILFSRVVILRFLGPEFQLSRLSIPFSGWDIKISGAGVSAFRGKSFTFSGCDIQLSGVGILLFGVVIFNIFRGRKVHIP